jgi:DNA invertase Pin-like site-specific DNA recombinase
MNNLDTQAKRDPDTQTQQDHWAGLTERARQGLVSPKIQHNHWERLAIVYVRQSTPQQVLDNRESQARQYALADYAATLGWPAERTLVIDEDQGRSGCSADERLGFQRLLLEVTLDHVGIVLALEMSRLARSNKDWHHLLELCALFGTLLADQEGVYDPRDPNDRLLLGLKGTMSELEIHTMRNRLDKGRLCKAQRGQLVLGLPVGYVKTPAGAVALEPDEQVRTVLALIFDKFDELGSVWAVFGYLVRHNIQLGIRQPAGLERGQLQWRRPSSALLYFILHHPIYAGTYVYGRRVVDLKRQRPGRRSKRKVVASEHWKVVLHDHLPAYISRERYLRNQERLRQNRSHKDAAGTPRQGSALLSGIVFCGRCGTRLRVCYRGRRQARYDCRIHEVRGLPRACHSVSAAAIDALVAQQLLRALQPAALELSLRAGQDVQRERQRLDLLWQQQLQRSHFECADAQRHYRAVDPQNRLVASTLEQQWEQALRQEKQLQEEYDRFVRQTPPQLTPREVAELQALATDIPALWSASGTSAADRKELLRCLLERVVVSNADNSEYVDVTLCWAGGFVSQHQVLRQVGSAEQLRDFDRLLERARQLRQGGCTAAQIAEQLHQEGFQGSTRQARWSKQGVLRLLKRQGLTVVPTSEEVLGPDEWRLAELARQLDVHPCKVRRWLRLGWVHSRRTGVLGLYIVWADGEELSRLRRLSAHAKAHPNRAYPIELTEPKRRQDS